MKSAILKRSIVLRGHKTSVSLEDEFWAALKEIASEKRITATELISQVDASRSPGNLSSSLRVMVLGHYRQGAAQVQAHAAE
jgi:predicted DNA-binding ribbon-helix-helix protein